MSKKKPNPVLTRRQAMKTTAAATGAATVGYGANRAGLDLAQDARAIPPAVLVMGGFVGGMIVTAAVTGSGSTKDPQEAAQETAVSTLEETIYNGALKSKMHNRRNILDQNSLIRDEGLNLLNGLEKMAYEDGVDAAIEAMNAGKTQADTLSDAKDAALAVLTPVQKYVADEWNVSVQEIESYSQQSNNINGNGLRDNNLMWSVNTVDSNYDNDGGFGGFGDQTETLINGDNYTVKSIGKNSGRWTCVSYLDGGPSDTSNHPMRIEYSIPNAGRDWYLESSKWHSVWSKIETAWSNVKAELELFVPDVYSDWQSGDISDNELFTSRQFATNAANDETMSRAISDLIALGVKTDFERATRISLTDDSGIYWEYQGLFAATSAPSTGLSVGQSYTPNSGDLGAVYMAVSPDNVLGEWSDFNAPVDGGVVEFTADPSDQYDFGITTSYGETVVVPGTDFNHDSANSVWTVDLGNDLENPITDVVSVAVYPRSGIDKTYLQLNIQNQFTIEEIVDETTGENVDSITISETTVSEPEAYRTKEDFQSMIDRNNQIYQEMLDTFQDVQGDTGGVNVGTNFPSLPGLDTVQSIGVIAGGIAVLNFLSGE